MPRKIIILLLAGLRLIAQSSDTYEYKTLQDKRTALMVAAGNQPFFVVQIVVPCKKESDLKKGKKCTSYDKVGLNTLAEQGWEVVSRLAPNNLGMHGANVLDLSGGRCLGDRYCLGCRRSRCVGLHEARWISAELF